MYTTFIYFYIFFLTYGFACISAIISLISINFHRGLPVGIISLYTKCCACTLICLRVICFPVRFLSSDRTTFKNVVPKEKWPEMKWQAPDKVEA